jgi:hypothetical protein
MPTRAALESLYSYRGWTWETSVSVYVDGCRQRVEATCQTTTAPPLAMGAHRRLGEVVGRWVSAPLPPNVLKPSGTRSAIQLLVCWKWFG